MLAERQIDRILAADFAPKANSYAIASAAWVLGTLRVRNNLTAGVNDGGYRHLWCIFRSIIDNNLSVVQSERSASRTDKFCYAVAIRLGDDLISSTPSSIHVRSSEKAILWMMRANWQRCT